ncbi:MAG: hypothetical protein N3B18_01660 [Desulfobacterota bacterium]|nr:hypothetical protein [Thermodesulfobacteriota bacterium]
MNTHYQSQRRKATFIQSQMMGIFIAAIAAVGYVMMTLTSSPFAKGASLLWLPASLQLIAGIWLGPIRGTLAGGIGAYLAGIIAYGGFGPVDIIMNLVAGGFANSFLPWLLFKILRIDPTFGSTDIDHKDVLRAALRLISIMIIAVVFAFIGKLLGLGNWGYIPSLIVVLISPLFLRGIKINAPQVLLGIFVCVFISLISSLIGGLGQVVAGNNWTAALIGTSLGWFLGDTVSSILGLYILAVFTDSAIKLKIYQP